jgi:hypothetical protein
MIGSLPFAVPCLLCSALYTVYHEEEKREFNA